MKNISNLQVQMLASAIAEEMLDTLDDRGYVIDLKTDQALKDAIPQVILNVLREQGLLA
jgi:ribosomal protein S8